MQCPIINFKKRNWKTDTRLRITLGELLHQCASEYGDRPFLTIAESGRSYSYQAFESLVNQLGHGLLARYTGNLNYLAIMLENSVEYLAMSYALKKIDSTEVAINPAFRAVALSRMIDLTGASVLLTSEAQLPAIDQIRADIPHVRCLIMINGVESARALFPELEVISFQQVLSEQTGHIESKAKDTDVASILFTSGTTGVSKGCLLSHRYAVRTAENMVWPYELTADDINYTPYPLSHIGPAYYDVLPSMLVGGQVIMRAGFSLSIFWKEIQKYGVTWFMMLGSVQQLLWSAPASAEECNHKVRIAWGTPLPVPRNDFEARFNLRLIPGGGYGSTDAGWVAVPQWEHEGGIVLDHFEVAIVDENDDRVPVNHTGELVVRPREPGVMSDGYFGMPEKTAESRRNLWFHTGDQARLDDQGHLYFLHRMSDRIRVKGEMVSAYEVEEVILTHPQVEDCAVIGVPANAGEEDIKLFVVKKPLSQLDGDQLREYCVERMAKFMVPLHIVFIDSMPRTSTGKPEKGTLSSMA
ncbi:MAG: crotonobetaine/carnitine-CoA ligase [Gammaproteobacteria bacterium]|jgi:crotonobetaine/carnitine-CoA ligase